MARPSSGEVLERPTGSGRTYALRFRALGERQYVTLGTDREGWTRHRAEQELADTLAAVRLGLWRPKADGTHAGVAAEMPTFHVYASNWLARREREGLKPKSVTALRWNLINHLLPFFADHRLDAITRSEVRRYTDFKIVERDRIARERDEAKKKDLPYRDRPLANASINQTMRVLSQVLTDAVDDEVIRSNSVGKKVMLKADKPARPWVEPEQLMTFLEAGSGTGRVLLALLAGSGLRIGEALALRWNDIDLGTGTLHVRAAKTEKGVREVHLTPALRELLTLARADRKNGDTGYVISTATGKKHNPSNLRRDVLDSAVSKANVKLTELSIAPIEHCTFHSLRRTFASLRCAVGDSSLEVADQIGHQDARFTERVYRQATKRRERLVPIHRREYDRAVDWARMGTSEPLVVPDSVAANAL